MSHSFVLIFFMTEFLPKPCFVSRILGLNPIFGSTDPFVCQNNTIISNAHVFHLC